LISFTAIWTAAVIDTPIGMPGPVCGSRIPIFNWPSTLPRGTVVVLLATTAVVGAGGVAESSVHAATSRIEITMAAGVLRPRTGGSLGAGPRGRIGR